MHFDDHPHDHPSESRESENAPPAESAAASPPSSAADSPVSADVSLAGPHFVVADPRAHTLAIAHQRMTDPSVPEDLRVPWGWLDLFFFILAAVAGAFFLGILGILVYVAGGGNFETIQRSLPVQGLISVIVQFVLDALLMVYLALHLHLRYRQPFWRTVGWRPLETTRFSKGAAYLALVVAGLVIGFVVVFASNLVPPKGEMPIQQLMEDRYTAMAFALMAVTIAPLFEETAFRGFLYPLIARRFGVGSGVIVTGVLFGLLHAGQLSGAWFQIGLLAGVGILFTLARAMTKSVVSSFLLHVSYNSLQVIGMIIATHGFRQMHALH
jgi:membrane protease YdiL (CAAX protease family)